MGEHALGIMAKMDDADFETPGLLDVVPWNYGFAHSWALRWLLGQPLLADRILGAIPGFDLPRPVIVEGDIRTERPLPPARADLAFAVRDADGRSHQVAVETKVGDPFSGSQIEAYALLAHRPILYLPGLTGLFLRGVPNAGELRLRGEDLASSLDGVVLPRFIQTYVDAVQAEAERMRLALDAERGEFIGPLPPGMSDEDTLRDIAWLVELQSELDRLCKESDIPADLVMRIVGHDRGIFWSGSWREIAMDGGGIYIDIAAEIRTHACGVAIKAGADTREGRAAAFDLTSSHGPPTAPGEWRHCARRVGSDSVSIWKLNVSTSTAVEAAHAALEARKWMDTIAADPGISE